MSMTKFSDGIKNLLKFLLIQHLSAAFQWAQRKLGIKDGLN